MSQIAFARFIASNEMGQILASYDVESALHDAEKRRFDFPGPGICVVTAMLFLEKRGVDFCVDRLASERLSDALEATEIVLPPESRDTALARIRAIPLSVTELLQFDADLNGVPQRDPLRAEPLKAAARFFHTVLRSMEPGETAIIEIA